MCGGRWGSSFCKVVVFICSFRAIFLLMWVEACVMVIGVMLCVGYFVMCEFFVRV